MGLPEDLLDIAVTLSKAGTGRPRQADLRRAISTAYYAIFHLLVGEGLDRLTTKRARSGKVARAFEHRDMKEASQAFARQTATKFTGGVAVPPEIVLVAQTFAELQEERHKADYDIDAKFTRLIASTLVQKAEAAFAAWNNVRSHPVSVTYLSALLFWKTWKR